MILLGIGILCVLAFAVVIGVFFGQRTQDADASPPRNTDDLDQLPESVREDILKSSGDWLCLLQLGTIRSKKNEIMFGDVGHLYVWIRKQDLAARNFSAAWVILQCF